MTPEQKCGMGKAIRRHPGSDNIDATWVALHNADGTPCLGPACQPSAEEIVEAMERWCAANVLNGVYAFKPRGNGNAVRLLLAPDSAFSAPTFRSAVTAAIRAEREKGKV